MLKKILLFFISLTLFTACDLRKKEIVDQADQSSDAQEEVVNIEEGQTVFDEAFRSSQKSYIDEKRSEIEMNLVVKVDDSENNFFPEDLKNINANLTANWDFTSVQSVAAYVLLSMSLNNASEPDLKFSAQLANGKLSMMLSNFNKDLVSLLGLDETVFGGTNPLAAINEDYIGKENVISLTEEQINQIIAGFGVDEEMPEKDEQEKAIIDSFIENNVIRITDGTMEDGAYVLSFDAEGNDIAKFLNDIAKLNNIEMDFSEYLKDLTILGIIKIKNNEILDFEAQVSRNDGVGEDETNMMLLMDINYSSEMEDTSAWSFVLMDIEKNMPEITVSISY